MYSLPFLIPLAALVAGILAASGLEGPAWGLLPVLGGLCYYFILLKKSAVPGKALRLNSRHAIWIFLLFAGIGMFDAWYHRPMQLTDEDLSRYSAAQGEVRRITSRADGERLEVELTHLADSSGDIRDCRNLKILLQTDGVTLGIGDIILFPVELKKVEDNPNFRPDGYAGRLRRQGINYRAYAKCERIISRGHNPGIMSASSEWRDRLASTVERSSMQRPTVNFIVALLLGDRSLLTDDVKETFSNAGVAHVLALSGLHVAIIMGIILFLLFPMKLAGLHRLRYWIALAMLWAYAYLSGLAPSTIRACIMTSFVIVALSIQRKNASGNALLASAFTILLFDPSALYDPGMQLSFLCVASILAFAGQLNTVNRHLHPRLHSAVSAILVSLVATGCTWVLVSYYFKKVPLLFLPVNLLILPLMPLYIGVALTYVMLLCCGIDIHFLACALDYGFLFFEYIADRLSAFGESTVSFQAQMPVVIFWLLGVLVIGLALKRRKNKTALFAGFCMLAGSLAIIPVLRNLEPHGFIIQKNSHDISIALYDHDIENVAVLPRNAISRIVHKGCEIISVDCRVDIDSLSRILSNRKRLKKRYMIMGSGFRLDSLTKLTGLDRLDKIILHPSLRRKIESELLQQASSIGMDRIHSIRKDGPMRVDITD